MLNYKTIGLVSLGLSIMACKPAPTVPNKIALQNKEPQLVVSKVDEDDSPEPIAINEDGSLNNIFDVTVDDDVAPVAVEEKKSPEKFILRIESTTQSYNPWMPWMKNQIQGRSGFGVLLEGGYILTSADMVNDQTFMSFSQHDNAKSYKAKLVAVDYAANLALIAPDSDADKVGLEGVEVMPIADKTQKNAPSEVWQVAEEGYPIVTPGTVQAYEMGFFSDQSLPFLCFLFKAPLQDNNLSQGVPVISDGKLVGLIKNYDNSGQISQVLDASVIRRFYEDALDGNYAGFPALGISVKETSDPYFRKYLKLADDNTGIYVNGVHKKSKAAELGLQKGDVILAIDGQKVDHRGYATTEWGELSWESLLFLNNKGKIGDQVQLTLWRNGEKVELALVLDNAAQKQTLVSDLSDGKAPNYIIHGGFVFIELSKPYLYAFGENWESRSPVEMVAIAQDSSEYEKMGVESVVILVGSIPTSATLGYNSVQNVILDSYNGEKVKSLKHLGELINQDQSAIQSIGVNRSPFSLYVSQKDVKDSNEMLQKRITPQLQRLGENDK